MKNVGLALIMLLNIAVSYSQTTLKGKITDKSGVGIENVDILILETTKGALTNEQGEYKINNLVPKTYFVQVSYMGYATQTKSIKLNVGENKLDITLLEAANELEEIVVSGANRRLEKLQKTPASISAITTKKIKEGRLWTFGDLTAISPNFNIQTNDGGYYNMSVRGISSYSKLPSVVTYIDDVPAFNGYMMSFNMQNIKNMEFLRGPQGTLYGRGASAGVLVINSKNPTNKLGGFVEASYGNYNNQRYGLGFKGPIVKDKILFSLSGLYAHTDGFYKNTFLNTKAGKENTFGLNAKLTFLPADDWLIRYQFRMENYDQEGAYQYGMNKEDAFKNAYKISVNNPGSTHRKFTSNSLVANYFGNGFSIKSISAFQRVDLRYGLWDLDGTSKDYQAYYTHSVDKEKPVQQYFTQELKFSGNTMDDKFNYTAGVFYMTGKEIDNIAYRYGKDSPPLDIGNGVQIPTPYNTLQFSTTNVNSYAFYGQLSYNFDFGTTLTLGGRYEIEKSKLRTRGELEALSIGKTVTTLPESKKEAKFNSFSPKVSVLHKINKNNSLYATYSRGYRAGGVNPYTSNSKYLEYKPEFSNNYEVGYKFLSADRRLRANLSAFWITLTDQQIYTLTGPNNFATLNIGEINSKGAEIELSWLITKGLRFDGNLGYTKAKYNKLPYFISDGKGGLAPADLKNNKPIQSPNLTSFNSLTYTTDLNKDMKLSIRGEWRYTGNQFFDYANQIEQKAYSLFNIRTELAYKNYSLALWARNIANKKHLIFAYPFWLPSAKISNPRMLGVTLNATF